MTKTILLATAALLATVSVANAKCSVSKSDYEALKTGMTIAQANAAVGCEAEELSQMDIGRMKMVSYSWDGPRPGALMMVIFSNGQLTSKNQVGLK